MANRDVSDYSSPVVLVDSTSIETPPVPSALDDVYHTVIDLRPSDITSIASEALWCDGVADIVDQGSDIVDTDLDAIVRYLGMASVAPANGDAHHRGECPCGGCRADREDPDPFLDDRAARRRELRRRSDVHSRYRNRVGRGSARDPGPRHYRPARAPPRTGNRR